MNELLQSSNYIFWHLQFVDISYFILIAAAAAAVVVVVVVKLSKGFRNGP
jgi:hypothetical protein